MEVRQGVFYGVGVGPGDPELLTTKALRTLERCSVIAAPRTKSGEMLALDIVRQAMPLEGKTILPLEFTMSRDPAVLRASRLRASETIAARLSAGQDVAMLNLGDVSIYATFGYLMDMLTGEGYKAVMVPGVPSFCAVAARLGASLTTVSSPLHILPGGSSSLAEQLDLPGTKVLMKSGRQLLQAAEVLRQKGLLEKAAMVRDCGLPTEQVCRDLTRLPEETGYFATVIVKE
ncbi:precorrin-2 C(20)-methyltransferase [Oscillospiraceae bacterium 50-60]